MRASDSWSEAGPPGPASPWPQISGAPHWPMSASATLSTSAGNSELGNTSFFFKGTFQKLVFMFNYEHKIHNFPIWLHYDWVRLALVRDWELTSTLTASSLGSTAASTTEYSSMTPHSSWFSILHTFKLFSFNFLQDECKQWSPSWHHVPLQNSGSWDTFQVIIKGFVPCKVSVTASLPGHQTWEPQQRPQPVCRGRRLQLPPLREVISREDGGLQVRLRSD